MHQESLERILIDVLKLKQNDVNTKIINNFKNIDIGLFHLALYSEKGKMNANILDAMRKGSHTMLNATVMILNDKLRLSFQLLH